MHRLSRDIGAQHVSFPDYPRYGSIGFQREVLGFVFAILQKMTVIFVVIYFALFALVLYRARSHIP